MYKKLLSIIFCIVVIITQVGCVSKEPVSKTAFYLDTSCTIEIRGMSKQKAEKTIDLAFEVCATYEKLLSRTIEKSDIYRINNGNGEPISVSPETLEVVTAGLEQSEYTQGKFDITMGRLTSLWDFSGDNPKVPAEKALTEALASVGYEKVKIDGSYIQITDPETWIDLGAIAKGYIADKLAEFLEQEGVTSGIVNLGGNIVTIGSKVDGSPWRIGIETPYSDKDEILGSIELDDQTVVTSGVYERYFEENGIKYHHVLDSKTGYPIETDIVSVSILGKKGTSMMCDSYSTICLILGKEKAIEFMSDKEGFEYCIVDTEGNIVTSDYFILDEAE